MRRRLLSGAPIALALLLAAATPARADWLLTPYLGINFGGAANFGDVGDLKDNFQKQAAFGGSLAWMGAGVLGIEFDAAWSPNFFELDSGDFAFDLDDSNLTTLMVNAMVGIPFGGQRGVGLRPYAAAGIGLLRSHISPAALFDDLDSTDLGVNAGGGLALFLSDSVGLRGDLRYFRSLQDNESDGNLDLGLSDFDFWRATFGVTIRF